MQYQIKSFRDHSKLIDFLNENRINKGNIVSIHQGTTASCHCDNRVVLIWYGFKWEV